MNIKTKFEEISPDSRSWFLIDATGLPVGRLASEVAKLIRGKHKASFAPHLDVGDHVVIVNASKVEMTANKPEAKIYYSHSGYPGGLKQETFKSLKERKPDQIIQKAVWGMLPKNRLGRSTIKKLHIYSDDKHGHDAQNPQELKLEIQKVE